MTSWKSFVAACSVAALSLGQVNSQEHHTVTFQNNCGTGTPFLKAGGQTLSTGQPFTSNGPLVSAIAYLQTGPCLDNGENCILVETTLTNPNNGPGSGSSTDLSLIPPHAFNRKAGFHYVNGCDGQGKSCDNANCHGDAFFKPDDTGVQVACQTPNANLVITFC